MTHRKVRYAEKGGRKPIPRVQYTYECTPYQCCPADSMPPERIGAWKARDGDIRWACAHNRLFSLCEDGAWEPHLSMRESSDREFNKRLNEVHEEARREEASRALAALEAKVQP